MITIKTQGFEDLLARLREMPRQIPYAMANGVNAVAAAVKTAEIAAMRGVFKNPTPFTLGSMRHTPAKAPKSATASVWFKDPPNLSQTDHYLLPQVEGGPRKLKPYEIALAGHYTVPGKGLQLDQYGNLGRGQLTKILSQSGAFRESGSKMNRTRKGGKVGDMFKITSRKGGLLPGIYERTMGAETGGRIGRYLLARALGAKKSDLNKRTKALMPRGIKPVLIFPSKTPAYNKRFDFYGVAQRVIDQTLRAEMSKSIQAEIIKEMAYRARKGL